MPKVIYKLVGPVVPGTKVGRWTLLAESARRYGLRHVRCRCDCGTERDVFIGAIRTGASSSCGCHRLERTTKHGLYNTPEHAIWRQMKNRCRNPNADCFRNYGGRGITVCQRWQDSFAAFLADVGQRPDQTLTLDRIDNERGYEPGNIRWATRKTQNANSRWTPERRSEHGRRNANARWNKVRQSRSPSS